MNPNAHASKAALQGGIDARPEHRDRIDDLAGRLERYRTSYYAGSPEISDAAYDALEDELRALDPTHPVLARVGASVLVTEWEKARHEIPMGSLNKAVSAEELGDWLTQCEKLLAKETAMPIRDDLFVAEKLDGISIEVLYRNGRMADAITRGDGIYGERVTANVARMRGVPARIPDQHTLSVRGEIILRLSDMRAHFPGATSPRSMAAGTTKRFDGEGAAHLTVLFYDIADHLDIATEADKFEMLRRLGFATPRTARGSFDEVLAIYDSYSAELRASLDYEIDGLVVSVSSLHAQALLGELHRRPRGAVAFKFSSPAKVTRVRRILWDTGPSGRVTPVAVVEPVDLAGAMVQRASLHNAARVRALSIGVGDEVLVSRRNDVIPYVEEVVERCGAPSEPPERCPVCDAPLGVEGEYLLCKNVSCRARVEGRIGNWVGAIGALEWGDKLIAQLVGADLVREPADLYRLSVADIANLERRGDKSAKKCLAELDARRALPLVVFLAALGIEGFAKQTAQLIVSAGFSTLDRVLAATEDELAAIPGLGAIRAGAIVRGLAARRDEIGRLLAVVAPVAPTDAGPLAGKTFCFTGALERPRDELIEAVEARGGRVLSTVRKDLDYLVIADPASTSSKAVKARKYGTKLVSETELDALLERAGEAPPAVE